MVGLSGVRERRKLSEFLNKCRAEIGLVQECHYIYLGITALNDWCHENRM